MNWPKTCSQTIKVNFPYRIFLGSEYIIPLPKSGDMITSVRLVLDLPSVNVLAEQIINKAEFLVGDNILESIPGDFLQILNDYGTNIEKRQAYQNNLNGPLVTLDIPFSIVKSGFHMVTVPSIRLSLTQGITQAEINGYLLVDYSLIEDQTKTTFVQRVTQNQNIRGVFTGATLVKFDTALVGPVYHLFFSAKVAGNYVDYIKNVRLLTDGQERFNLGKQYLKYVEPLKIFKSIASEPVLFYSFCVEGEGVPSGSMNFSRIDTQRFEIELLPNTDEVQVDIWAQSHNFMYFNSSNVSPIFDTHESLLTSTQDQYLSALQDLPVTLSYRFYLNSVTIFYHTNEDIIVVPELETSSPILSIGPLYQPGVITINNIYDNTYLVFNFSSPGYNTVRGAFTIKYVNAHPLNFTEGPIQYYNYTEVTDIDIKVDQYPIITMNTGCHPLSGLYESSMIYDFEIGSFLNLTDSYSIRKQISETALAIDYGDNFYVAATVNRNIYNKNQTIFSNSITGGCIIKYDSDYNPLWVHPLRGNYPSIDYLYPKFYVSSSVPLYGNGDAFIRNVFCSAEVTMLVDSYNNLMMGGTNQYGQCGNGPVLTINVPGFFIPVGCPGVSSFSTGAFHTMIVDSTGKLWATGDNTFGQIGLGSSGGVTQFSQVPVTGDPVFSAVSCGYNFTFALDSTGKLWATGDNTFGQLGLGGVYNVTQFTQVPVTGNPVFSAVSCGTVHTMAIDLTGEIWGSGDNSYGQLGLGATSAVNQFTQISISGNPVISFISCGFLSSIAIDSTGIPYVTGDNFYGQIGLGRTRRVNQFTRLYVPGDPVFVNGSCSSLYNSCLVDNTGNLWVTGSNSSSQLGLRPSYQYPYENITFQQITAVFNPIGKENPVDLPPPVFVSASFGNYHLVAVDSSGHFWVAGMTGITEACIGTSQPSHKLLFNKITQQYRGLSNTIDLQIINTEGQTVALNQITADQIRSKNIVVDANGNSYIDVIYSSNSTIGQLPSTNGVLTAAVIKVDENLNFMGCVRYGLTNCKTIIDRQNINYTTYIDQLGNLVLTFLGKTVTVTNIRSTTNFYTEIDFLGNIYLCGTYSPTSTVPPRTTNLPWGSDTYGGTFIMKINKSANPVWIIRIKNTDSTSNNIVSRILANSYTGIIYVVGYLSCTLNQPQTIYDGFGTQSSFGPIVESSPNRDGINGFMFSFDPSGYVIPPKTTIPPNDFFDVKFEMLIGTHPISTFAVPQFFPPHFFQYPPVSLDPYSDNPSRDLGDPYSINVVGAPWGNGIYTISGSSYQGTNYPTRVFNLTKGGVEWITYSESYQLPDGTAQSTYLNFQDESSITGEYVAMTLPSPVKMDYISFIESAAAVYSEPSTLFTVIGTNEYTENGNQITFGVDTSILYTKTQETVTKTITGQVTSSSIHVDSLDNLYQGMMIDGTGITITNISDSGILSLSADYVGYTVVTFIDTKSKVLKLNTTKPYQMYFLCAQKMRIHPNGGTWRIAYIVYNSTTELTASQTNANVSTIFIDYNGGFVDVYSNRNGLYFTGNNVIRKIDPSRIVSTVAGTPGVSGYQDGTGSGALFDVIYTCAGDRNGNIYVVDQSYTCIRKITPSGIVSTIAGVPGVSGYLDGPGSTAKFNGLNGIGCDKNGNIYVGDQNNNVIRKITTSGIVSTVAGVQGVSGYLDGPASTAKFSSPLNGVAVDQNGNIYVADDGNRVIRKITPSGTVSTIAGVPGVSGYLDGPGSTALFGSLYDICVDNAGNIYGVDQNNNVIRKIDPYGTVSTIAGVHGVSGYLDGIALLATFNGFSGICCDPDGTVYITDQPGGTSIRKVK